MLYSLIREVSKKSMGGTQQAYNAQQIANYVIYLASQEEVGDYGEKEGITNLKLQKILYFLQAYFLSKEERALFSEDIYAWKHGPVVPQIYGEYKDYGSNPIMKETDTSGIDAEDKMIIQKLWEQFGDYSAHKLVEMTHEHQPWKKAYDGTGQNTIPKEELAEYYAPLFN